VSYKIYLHELGAREALGANWAFSVRFPLLPIPFSPSAQCAVRAASSSATLLPFARSIRSLNPRRSLSLSRSALRHPSSAAVCSSFHAAFTAAACQQSVSGSEGKALHAALPRNSGRLTDWRCCLLSVPSLQTSNWSCSATRMSVRGHVALQQRCRQAESAVNAAWELSSAAARVNDWQPLHCWR
jgi:hypothetical protein